MASARVSEELRPQVRQIARRKVTCSLSLYLNRYGKSHTVNHSERRYTSSMCVLDLPQIERYLIKRPYLTSACDLYTGKPSNCQLQWRGYSSRRRRFARECPPNFRRFSLGHTSFVTTGDGGRPTDRYVTPVNGPSLQRRCASFQISWRWLLSFRSIVQRPPRRNTARTDVSGRKSIPFGHALLCHVITENKSCQCQQVTLQ